MSDAGHTSTLAGPSAERDITADDFITGLIAGFAARDVSSVSIRSPEFYRAVERLFANLQTVASNERLDVRFLVALDPVYEDSPVVRDAISGAVQRDLVSLDNPEYQDMRLKVGRDEARLFLERLPGGPSLFLGLADNFINDYPWVVQHH